MKAVTSRTCARVAHGFCERQSGDGGLARAREEGALAAFEMVGGSLCRAAARGDYGC
jgi:hypothetical protein